MSTRKLIIAALVCGMAILVAGAFQFLQIANDQHSVTDARHRAVSTTRPRSADRCRNYAR